MRAPHKIHSKSPTSRQKSRKDSSSPHHEGQHNEADTDPTDSPETEIIEDTTPPTLTRRKLLDLMDHPPTNRPKPEKLREGDEVIYDDGIMRGIVQGFSENKVIITPTHIEDQPISPEDLKLNTNDGQTVSWHKGDVKPYISTTEIKKVHPEGVDITHFHTGPMTASEYIRPHGDGDIRRENDIEITNHGLGSGIYGFAEASEQSKKEARRNHGSTAYPIHLNRPLYLQDPAHGTQLTDLSKTLQSVATAFREQNGKSKDTSGVEDWITAQRELATLTAKFKNVISRAGGEISTDDAESGIVAAMEAFFADYYSGKDYVAQPINFLLEQHGYDGVYATDDVNNAFNRGCVAYTVPKGTNKTTKSDRLKK